MRARRLVLALAGAAILVIAGVSLWKGFEDHGPEPARVFAGIPPTDTPTSTATPTNTPTFKATHTPKNTSTPDPFKNTPPPFPTTCSGCPFVTPTDPGPTSTFPPTVTPGGPGQMWRVEPVVVSRLVIRGLATTTTSGDTCQGFLVPFGFGVASTAGFPAGGWFYVRKDGFTTFFVYNSKTASSFNITSCTGPGFVYKPNTPVRGGDLYLLCLTRFDPYGSVPAGATVTSRSVCYHTFEPQAPPGVPDKNGPAGSLPDPNGNGIPFLGGTPLVHLQIAGAISSSGRLTLSLAYPTSIGACVPTSPNGLSTLSVTIGVGESANFVPAVGSATLTRFDAPPSTDCSGAGLIGTFFGPYTWTQLLPVDNDQDRDGCTDRQELAGDFFAKTGQQAGGLRDPWSFWDFYDVPTRASLTRDGAVSAPDFFAVLGRFNATGDPGIDPLSTPPPMPAYHTAYDRGGAIAGGNAWNLTPADGSIAGPDFFRVLAQFGHTCA